MMDGEVMQILLLPAAAPGHQHNTSSGATILYNALGGAAGGVTSTVGYKRLILQAGQVPKWDAFHGLFLQLDILMLPCHAQSNKLSTATLHTCAGDQFQPHILLFYSAIWTVGNKICSFLSLTVVSLPKEATSP